MLIDISKYNNLGNINEIEFMITNILSDNLVRVEDIEKYCLYNSLYIRMPVKGILCLLNFISLIEIQENSVCLNNRGINIKSKLRKGSTLTPLIATDLINRLFFGNNCMLDINKIKYNKISNIYTIRNSDISIKFSNLRNLIINVGIFQLNQYSKNNLKINNEYIKCFKMAIKNKRLKMNLKELKKQLIIQQELGNEAELFVIKYEINRLQNHPTKEKISRISEIDVTAGYDIISFDSINSIEFDRYIEVKSYNKNVGFYWSNNEIQVSENLRDKYYIYLVDRNKINVDKYKPIIIKNPYKNIYNNNMWSIKPQNWFVEPIKKIDFINYD
ncbi:hypothetical protein SH1V18_34690 [Vallitalea longa]|uniref:Protein NO VEIN C-terminal domain-containing protein n=1 Tax=Vallitalea longa TaxID=2936439 RepID=A0A9W5YDC8_9FIRM|nr:DUF3883 domain-containing protein [Vallitalea longa]GKX30989.1 hypothetical protein SH1V18_34690 [Vallitalea longa]